MPADRVVHVIDDEESVRTSLAVLLESAGFDAATYGSAEAFLALAPTLSGGCVVTDVRMPGMDGLELQRQLRERGIDLPVIVMTGHGDVPVAVRAMQAGALDFVEKPFDDEALLSSVRSALEQADQTRRAALEAEEIADRLASLTPQERHVLDGLVAGNPNKVIAFDLGISPRTVEVYRARVME